MIAKAAFSLINEAQIKRVHEAAIEMLVVSMAGADEAC